MVTSHDDVAKVIFASETCLPIVPLHVFIHTLSKDADSWVNFSDRAKNGYANEKQVSVCCA
jgi:hypothetical protein